MKMSSAASILMNPFQPVLNALPIDGDDARLRCDDALRRRLGAEAQLHAQGGQRDALVDCPLHRLILLDQRLPLGELTLQAEHVAEVGRCLEELANPVEAGLRGREPGIDVDHLAGHVFGALRGGATLADVVEISDRRLHLLGRQLDHERGGRRPVVGDVDRSFVDLPAVSIGQRHDIVDPLGDVGRPRDRS